jgi:hypothetical protein
MNDRRPLRLAAFGVVALALVALGADEKKTQTISARGLTFQAPASWKSSPPSNTMRLAQFKVDPAEGDKGSAELVVFVFPGGAGSVEANLDRWQQQFQDENGRPPKITTEKRKGKNVDVIFVETAGRYVAAVTPGSREKNDKPNYRLLGAIVQTPGAAYYLKMVGPDKTMTKAKPAFDDLIKSIEVEK